MIDKKSQKLKQQQVEQSITNTYQIIEKLGSGAYGHVWKVIHKQTKKQFALKKVFSAFQNDVDAQRTYRQISLLRKLDHPNVVKLQQVIQADNNMDLYLIFEYVQSDLFNAIRDDVLNQLHKKYIVYQIAKCLKYLHSAGVVHRDLKPSNILVNESCKIKVCDFGLSRTLYKYNDQMPIMTQFIATRWFRAPEVLFGSTRYDEKTDLWSFGCLIYQLFTGNPLLPGDDSLDQIQKLLEFKGQPSQQEKKKMKVQKIDFVISQLNVKKVAQKYYFQCLEDKPQVVQLVKNLLEYDPQKRWSVDQILQSKLLSEFNNYQPIIVSENQIKLYPNDNQKLTVQIYRNMVYKFFTKKIQKGSSLISKRNLLSQFKKSGTLYIGHHSLHHSKSSKISLNSFSTVNNSIHIGGACTSGHEIVPKNSQQPLKRHKNDLLSRNMSPYLLTPSMNSISKRNAQPRKSHVLSGHSKLKICKQSNQDQLLDAQTFPQNTHNKFNQKKSRRTKKQTTFFSSLTKKSSHLKTKLSYSNLTTDYTGNQRDKSLNIKQSNQISYISPKNTKKVTQSHIKRPKLKQNKDTILNRNEQRDKRQLRKKNWADNPSYTNSFYNAFM